MSKKNHNRFNISSASGNSQQTASDSQYQTSSDVTQNEMDSPKPFRSPVLKVERQAFFLAFSEILLVFAVFFVYGARAVPDTNEPYYVGKAFHAWRPDVLKNDAFLNSYNAHWFFYQTFGWLSLYCDLNTATWIGRVVLWLALAIGWYRLSRAIIPVAWFSALSSVAFAYFMLKFQMAGEWVIGGVEGKVFAYVFVIFGLDALARNRWGFVWVMFGIAAAYHPVVGGWSVVAGGFAWLLQRKFDRTPLLPMLVPLMIGGLLSLPGVLPAILMDWGCDKEIAYKAYRIAAFERLAHHEYGKAFSWAFVTRLGLLTAAWLFCSATVWTRKKFPKRDEKNISPKVLTNEQLAQYAAPPGFRIAGFVIGTILISCVGFIISYGFASEKYLDFAASLLRFYWFRMTDFSVPLGMGLCGTALLGWVSTLCERENFPKELTWWTKIFIRAAIFLVVIYCAVYAVSYQYYFHLFTKQEMTPTWNQMNGIRQNCEVIAYGAVLLISGFLLFYHRNYGNAAKQEETPRVLPSRPVFLTFLTALILFGGSVPSFLEQAEQRISAKVPRTSGNSLRFHLLWRDMCGWIAKNTEEDAVFLIPRNSESFRWYANRANVAVWKETPQDSKSMLVWSETIRDCYSSPDLPAGFESYPFAYVLKYHKTPEEIGGLQKKYDFSYILTEFDARIPLLDFSVVYKNERYILYRVAATESQTPPVETLPPSEMAIPSFSPTQ